MRKMRSKMRKMRRKMRSKMRKMRMRGVHIRTYAYVRIRPRGKCVESTYVRVRTHSTAWSPSGCLRRNPTISDVPRGVHALRDSPCNFSSPFLAEFFTCPLAKYRKSPPPCVRTQSPMAGKYKYRKTRGVHVRTRTYA